MSYVKWMRKEKEAELPVAGGFASVFRAAQRAAMRVGKVQLQDPGAGFVAVRTSFSLVPLRNPVFLRVTVKAHDAQSCLLHVEGECQDGLVGVNSVGRMVERYLEIFREYLQA